jgi:uncharacterized protein YjbJ (UPF0337 family)
MSGIEDETKGTIKKTVGKALGDRKLTNEGRAQKTVGKAKRKVEDAKDGVKGAVKGVRESVSRDSRG